MRRFEMFAGFALAAFGIFYVFMLYGFGTMLDPDLGGAAREVAIWRAVVAQPSFPVGPIAIVAGAWLMVSKSRRAGPPKSGRAGPG